CSSLKVADRQPPKRQKCEQNSLVNSELEGLTCGSENLAAMGETPKTPDGDQHSEDPGEHNVIQQGKGEGIPEAKGGKQERNVSMEPHAVKSGSARSGMHSDGDVRDPAGSEEEEEEGVCSAQSGGSSSEPDQPDNSAFQDEDSNQPMPVHRFFGDGEFLQDLPAAALPRTRMSRREFRKLHFIAKEDEEEEEEDV
ncbi:CA174 protein, partial [Columbina picui]|nr:CA174 protein [Columbina picui]